MIAYVIILIICIIWYIICKFFNLNFEEWKRIVCSATFASYFFTVASHKKTQANVLVTVRESIQKSINSLTKLKEKKKKQQDDPILTVEYLENAIKEDMQIFFSYGKQIEQANKASFIWNTIGFIFFFCIAFFDFFYSVLADGQELLTLLAFVVILVSDIYEEYWIDRYKRITELNTMEDTTNGQT